MRHPVTAMASALALLFPIPAAGQRTATRCDISAFVVDEDAAGLNVRSGPSATAPVLRTVSNAGSGVARIVEQNGAWFRVTAIVDAEDDTTLFRGDGWVHVSLLGTSVANEDPRLYAAPRRQSRALARLVPDATLVTLIGCDGAWAQVRAAGRVGWLSPGGQCSNPLTTCV
jgi:SH3-like domain-containing protein